MNDRNDRNDHDDRNEREERVDRYLEGSLDPEETVQFERDLLKPEVAQAFRKELMLRELLATTPDAEPPPHLAAEIEDALQVAALEEEFAEPTKAEPTDAEPKKGRFSRIRDILSGLSWSYRGPAMAVQAAGVGSYSSSSQRAATGLSAVTEGSRRAATGLSAMTAGSRGAATGLSSIRYALGPLADRSARSRPKPKRGTGPEGDRPKRGTLKPLWRRALGRLRKR